MKTRIELLSNLFREIESDVGSGEVSCITLRSLINSIKVFEVSDTKEFYNQFKDLVYATCNTEPKFGCLNYYYRALLKELKDFFLLESSSTKNCKNFILEKIEELIIKYKEENALILKNAEKIDVEGKTILIHDQSNTVHQVLAHLKKLGKNFNVIISEQDYNKTHDNIEKIHNLKIPFQVIPSYMLNLAHNNIDIVFFGALTLKNTMDFVMSPGAYGIISEFNIVNIPIYVFLNTIKFSLWESKKKGEVFLHKHSRLHHSKPISYERLKCSHDRVPSKLFHRIITNEGVFTSQKLEDLYNTKMKNYTEEIK